MISEKKYLSTKSSHKFLIYTIIILIF